MERKRKVGDCLTRGCEERAELFPDDGEWCPRGWCTAHLKQRTEQVALQGGARVIMFGDYERDPLTGRVWRKT
jgi:hypothetical protein